MHARHGRLVFKGMTARRGGPTATWGVAALVTLAACSPLDGGFHEFTGGDGPSGQGGNGAAATASSTSATGTTTGDFNASVGVSAGGDGVGGAAPTCTPGGPDNDVDGDGFTPAQNDLDDCDPNTNPNAIEVPTPKGGDPKDENCDGKIDEPQAPPCDDDLILDELDPMKAARAVDLCKLSTGPKDWGLVEAKWVLADGSEPLAEDLENFHLGHGLLPAFGANVKVRQGARLLALSSGTARQPDDPGYTEVGGFSKGYVCGNPAGFPKESPACPDTLTGAPHDATGLELKLRAPSNAHGFSFDFDFFTYEWPTFICSSYNDFFVALLSPFPKGQTDGNVSFDSQGNPVSVNNAFVEVCGCAGNPPKPCLAGTPPGQKSFTCALGNVDLIGTGFGFDSDSLSQDHGSTGWLQTKAPIEPGAEITLRWAVYDSKDGILDTTTLVDHWQWIATAGITVGTTPIPK
jgi:hypothetical protein